MKILMDLKRLNELKLSPNDVAFLYTLKQDRPITLIGEINKDTLEKISAIKIMEDGTVVLRNIGLKILEDVISDEPVTTSADDPANWINDYRDLFKNKKPGSMGDKRGCLEKMRRFLSEYPDATKDQIFNATKSYITSCAKDGYRYLQRANYFIYKQDAHKNEVSSLAAWVDELGDKEELKDNSVNQFIKEA